MVANSACIALIVCETLLFNGIFGGWGMMTAMFNDDELFIDKCNGTGDYLDCSARYGI